MISLNFFILYWFYFILYWWSDQPDEIEDDLDPADDGESSEESHGSSNQAQLALQLDLLVSLDVVKGCRVKVDLN